MRLVIPRIDYLTVKNRLRVIFIRRESL